MSVVLYNYNFAVIAQGKKGNIPRIQLNFRSIIIARKRARSIPSYRAMPTGSQAELAHCRGIPLIVHRLNMFLHMQAPDEHIHAMSSTAHHERAHLNFLSDYFPKSGTLFKKNSAVPLGYNTICYTLFATLAVIDNSNNCSTQNHIQRHLN